MSTFTELVTDVMKLTKRPDLVEETKLAVRQATLKAHHSDYYYKDILEISFRFNTPASLQSLDYRALVPRYRSLKYLRRFDASYPDAIPFRFLKILDPNEALDQYSYVQSEVAYVAGSYIQLRGSSDLDGMIMGCYIHPDTTEVSYNSWIALDHPYAIVYEAALTVFKTIGYDEQAAMYERLVAQQLVELKMSNIQAEGY